MKTSKAAVVLWSWAILVSSRKTSSVAGFIVTKQRSYFSRSTRIFGVANTMSKRSSVKSVSPTSSTAAKAENGWYDLGASPHELTLSFTLGNGQYFSWKKLSNQKVSARVEDNIYVGVIDQTPVALRQTETTTLYKLLLPQSSTQASVHSTLRAYFQLHIPLLPLYQEWSASCERLAVISKCLPGVRIIDQSDPWECVVSFITSANNNIKRITQLIDTLTRLHGTYLCSVVSTQSGEHIDVMVKNIPSSERDHLMSPSIVHLYEFPSVATLSSLPESAYTEMGFGYRAAYIKATAEYIHKKGGKEWLMEMRRRTNDGINDKESQQQIRNAVQAELLELHGVGRKVRLVCRVSN
jgi:3-methyladenine DNA glycosylase/8-oxoguanine DNA glycosylase